MSNNQQLLLGEGAGGAPAVFIEDVFSTYLYTGNGSTQTITNGIDLAGKGGLVWNQSRSNTYGGYIYDTARGTNRRIQPFSTAGQSTTTQDVTAFNSNGFAMGSEIGINGGSGQTYASWTFRKQPKFFDVVTWTGNGTAGRTIAHNLGSTPGCVIVKCTSNVDGWVVQHRSLNTTSGQTIQLDSTAAAYTANVIWNSTAATSTVFTVGNDGSVNGSGRTYVAYLFAHDAGGFGLAGTDNVISCGGYTGDNTSNRAITLGYEPQWILWKSSSYPSGGSETNWQIYDTMRGWLGNAAGTGADSRYLVPNTSSAEAGENAIAITPTGFTVGKTTGSLTNKSGDTYIYIAIRRGPMKVPTVGTSVFSPAIGNNSATAGGEIFTAGFPVDFFMRKVRATTDYAPFAYSRLTAGKYLVTGTTAAEATDTSTWFDDNDGIRYQYASNFSGQIGWLFQRAPGFFDVVCYTGTGVVRTVSHNLTVAPELMIIKRRNGTSTWPVWSKPVFDISSSGRLLLNETTERQNSSALFNSTAPTNTVFTLGTSVDANSSGGTYVAYLFATCAGVSKVGSYTGTGTTLQINCGFTAGARFVMIKRTDSTGDWYVWDSARGIVAGNDPYLLLNSTAAEVTSTDYVDTYSLGFEISSTAPAAINASGGTFIFLAIA
jgi:hypothetical protein